MTSRHCRRVLEVGRGSPSVPAACWSHLDCLCPIGLPASLPCLSVSLTHATISACLASCLSTRRIIYIPHMSPCRSGVSVSDSLPASLPFSPVSRRCQLPLRFSPPPFWWTARLCAACCTPGQLSAWLPLCFIRWRWGENR